MRWLVASDLVSKPSTPCLADIFACLAISYRSMYATFVSPSLQDGLSLIFVLCIAHRVFCTKRQHTAFYERCVCTAPLVNMPLFWLVPKVLDWSSRRPCLAVASYDGAFFVASTRCGDYLSWTATCDAASTAQGEICMAFALVL